MDRLIDKKLEELEEAEIGSNKDIVDILEASLRMSLAMQKIELDKEKPKQPLSPIKLIYK